MPKPEFHIFICGQHRPEGHPRGSCGAKGADPVFDAFAQELIKANLTSRVALTRTGCLGPCQAGANVLIYPGSQMYSWVENADAAPIIKSMLAGEVFADKATPAELW